MNEYIICLCIDRRQYTYVQRKQQRIIYIKFYLKRENSFFEFIIVV